MLSEINKNRPYIPFTSLPVVLIFIAGLAVLHLCHSGSAPRFLVGYPFIALFPAIFFFALLSGRVMDLNIVLPASLMVGPVFSVIVGAAGLYLGGDMQYAAWSVSAVGLALAIVSLFRRQEWRLAKPDIKWLPVAAYAAVLIAFVAVPLLRTLNMRLSHHGWFHSALAYRIIIGGIPPEDPIFPGGPTHNYWFYHTWGAMLSWLFHRPPPDIFSLVNITALAGVIFGVWACTGELFRSYRLRLLALLFSTLGLNTLGAVYFVLNPLFGIVRKMVISSPSFFYQNLVLRGDFRVAHFLLKFMNENAFPLGVGLYVCCLLFCIRIIRSGSDRVSLASVFLAVLGAFLFHPTTAFGEFGAVSVGLLFILVRDRNFKRFSWRLVSAGVLAACVSMPYLFSIFPSETQSISLSLSRINTWNTLSLIVFMFPFVIRGIINDGRSGEPAAVFNLGAFAGTLAVALFLMLPGYNQYKFILLAVIPSGFLAAAAFRDDKSRWMKNALLGLFIVLTLANLCIVEWAFYRSDWWRVQGWTASGIHLNPEKGEGAAEFYEWIRSNTDEDSVIVTRFRQYEMILSSERFVICNLAEWVSIGHPGAEERREAVRRILGNAPFSRKDMETLKVAGRPLYFFLPPAIPSKSALSIRFERRKDLFEKVYDVNGYRLFLLRKDQG